MNILITGANGFIGRELLKALLEQQHHAVHVAHVVACVRNPESIEQNQKNLQVVTIDFSHAQTPEVWLPLLQDIDVVINTVGIIEESAQQTFAALHTDAPTALFNACNEAGVKRIIQCSALGADASATTAYHLSKQAADDVLSSLPLEWFILRPSLVIGEAAKSLPLFLAMAALPLMPIIGSGKQLIQPILIDDVISSIVRCLNPEIETRKILDLVGPRAMSFKQFLTDLRSYLGKAPNTALSIPLNLTLMFAPLGKWLNIPAFNKQSLIMLEAGNHASDDGISQHLGRKPKPIKNKLRKNTASQAIRWQSQLYFMRPLLRISIAMVWIWTGLVSTFFYPVAESYQLLNSVGISGNLAPIMLYSAAMLDIALGIAVLFAWQLRWGVYIQILTITLYSFIIGFTLPEFLLHPFGPISKNIPLIVATWILLILEEEKP